MDTTGLYDEVVADSEEEDNTMGPQFNEGVSIDTTRSNSHLPDNLVSASTGLNAQLNENAIIALQSEPTVRPRPRPRLIYKKAGSGTVGSPSSGADTSTSPPLPPQSAFTSGNNIDTPTSTSNIADRAKTRSRKTKPKVTDIIELTSDEDEMTLLPVPKPRPKPKPKNNAKSKASHLSNNNPTFDVQGYFHGVKQSTNKHGEMSYSILQGTHATQDTIPVPTSSLHPNEFLPFKLPPSDPPASTAATYDHPPIVTLPVHDTDMDIPPSSPSSLFSVPSSSRKRKRKWVDELDSERGEDPSFAEKVDVPIPRLTGSSPSLHNTQPHTPLAGIVDLAIIPTMANPKLPSKKTPRQRKALEKSGETPKGGQSPETGKPRPKKAKAPKKKLEVVIDERSKKKGKEKEKQVFKSKEFIDDDGSDEADDIPAKNITNSPKPESLTSLSSVPDSEDDLRESLTKRRGRVAPRSPPSVTKDKAKDSDATHNGSGARPRDLKKGKGKRVIVSDDEDQDVPAVPLHKKGPSSARAKDKGKRKAYSDALEANTSGDRNEELSRDQSIVDEGEPKNLKENIQPTPSLMPPTALPPLFASLASRYTIAPKTKSTPMSELIRRVNSLPGSPFSTPRPRASGPSHLGTSGSGTAYSPYLKSSKSLLSRIAPLHPNRRTPPPPLPPPPPPKKSKKEREREEQWEEELVESVGGITEWACMTDAERGELRKAKREQEMSGWED